MSLPFAGDSVEALGAVRGVVCLVGAGGKKSTIYHIASASAGRVAITSTVHTPPFRKHLAGETLVAPHDGLKAAVSGRSGARIVAYACPSDKKARLAGVDPRLVEDIHAFCGFDLTLVKADGARLRWMKAPGPHEPALPARIDTLIPVVSLRAAGRPLDNLVVHRPDLVAALAGARPGDIITSTHIARVMAHPDGGMKYAERAASVVPVINMVDSAEHRHLARLVAEQVLQQASGVDRVVLARMISRNPVLEVIRDRPA